MTRELRRVLAALAAAPLLAVAACGGGLGAAAAGTGGGRLTVVASFYPLQYVAQRVAGHAATVSTLTKAGAEPHDLELSPGDVARVSEADLVVYLGGFQPAVDEAVEQAARRSAFDAAGPGHLDLTYTPIEEGRKASRQAGTRDPHFWLDPLRLADVGDALAQRLGAVDPTQGPTFAANAAALRRDLEALDREFAAGLRTCAGRDLVTSHNAFGYLARRYGLHQVGVTGLTPEEEPSARDLSKVAAYVRAHAVRTVYYETLVSPDIARTVAAETGARTAVLDPVEGLTERSGGGDYLAVMRSNLATLEQGQRCP